MVNHFLSVNAKKLKILYKNLSVADDTAAHAIGDTQVLTAWKDKHFFIKKGKVMFKDWIFCGLVVISILGLCAFLDDSYQDEQIQDAIKKEMIAQEKAEKKELERQQKIKQMEFDKLLGLKK